MATPSPTVVSSTSASDAEEGFARAFPSLRVSVRAARSDFAFDYRGLATERFAVHRLRCAGSLRASGPLPDSISVGRRSAGTVAIHHGARSIDTSRPYLRPVAESELEVLDGEVMLIVLQPRSVMDYLERSGERGAAVSAALQNSPQLTAWGLVMDHAATVLDEAADLTDRAQDELHDLLCWSLMQAFDDPWAETVRGGTRSTALRRALRYLEEHASGTVTTPEVAEAARVSVRTLHSLFRRELDTTPHRWLRDTRLDRARVDLMSGIGTVAETAARHGLMHAGRFSASYRARFGEHPADTLRGTRR